MNIYFLVLKFPDDFQVFKRNRTVGHLHYGPRLLLIYFYFYFFWRPWVGTIPDLFFNSFIHSFIYSSLQCKLCLLLLLCLTQIVI